MGSLHSWRPWIYLEASSDRFIYPVRDQAGSTLQIESKGESSHKS